LPGLVHIDIGTNKILQSIYKDLQLQKTVLYVSHDFIIGTFIANMILDDLFIEDKLKYLNGICFTLENNKMIMHLQNKSFECVHSS